MAVQFPLYEACKAKMAEKQHTTVDHLDPLSVVSTFQYAQIVMLLMFAPSCIACPPMDGYGSV